MSLISEITAGREIGRTRPRGYDLGYKPHQKTRHLLSQVEQVIEEYSDYLPVTVRQIFYRLVGQHGYAKTEEAYARLAEVLVRARRAQLIPFDVIRDDGVVTINHTFYDGVEAFADETGRRARKYRRDRQIGQQQYIELWCEAAGMLGQMTKVAREYSIPVYSCGGFGSLTANYLIAERALDRDVATMILHVGDFDPSGEAIFKAMTDDAAAFVEADRVIHTQTILPVRVALTEDQVDQYELDTSPPKKDDGRSRRWEGETCQLEALAPDLLAMIVRDAIELEMDMDVYHEQIAQEVGERAELLALPAGGAA